MFYRKTRILSVLAGLQVAVFLPLQAQFSPIKIMNALQDRQPNVTLVSSHRGEINGLYANNMPENSIGAGLNAVYAGIEMIEVDVWNTQDKVPYLMHDHTLERSLALTRPANRGTNSKDMAPYWNEIQNVNLCAGRGQTINYDSRGNPIVDPSGQVVMTPCTPQPDQTPPSLQDFLDAIATAKEAPGSSTPWGGVIQLDIRDQNTLQEAWAYLIMKNKTNKVRYLDDQVIFKFSPAKLKLKSLDDLIGCLANSTYYTAGEGGGRSGVIADMQQHMNFMAVYQAEDTISNENASNNAQWAVNDWKSWVQTSGKFHRMLSPMVGVKASPGKFVDTNNPGYNQALPDDDGSDPLYDAVYTGNVRSTTNTLNTVGVYSPSYECITAKGPKNLPNSSIQGYNGYWADKGKCAKLIPQLGESGDGIDHRYDYSFVSGTLNFGMIIADTAGNLVTYLKGKNLRELSSILAEVEPPANLIGRNLLSNSADLTWTDPNPPNSDTPTYSITFAGGPNRMIGYATSQTPSFHLTGLSPNSTYLITVSETLGGMVSSAISLTIGTPAPSGSPAVPPPSSTLSPTQVTVSNIQNTAATLTWSDPNPSGAGSPTYNLMVSGGGAVVFTSTQAPTFTFSGLYSAMTYSVAISETIGGITSAPTNVTFTTGLVRPANFNFDHLGITTAGVSWTDPNNLGPSVPTYTVSLGYLNRGPVIRRVVTVNNPSYLFEGLPTGLYWSARVQETVNGITTMWTDQIGVTSTWNANPLPGLDYSNCANEGQQCAAATGTNYLAFGAGTSYYIVPSASSISSNNLCQTSTLGGDPDPEIGKTCSAGNQSPHHDLTPCAGEGGSCTAGNNGGILYFDAYLNNPSLQTNYEAVYLTTLAPNQVVNCSTNSLGDPAEGTPKQCYLYNFPNGHANWDADPFPNYYNCGNEGSSCPTVNGSGYSYLAFGFGGRSVIQSFSASAGNSISCSVAQFGEDPYAGVSKSCSTGNILPTQYTQCATEGGACTAGPNGGMMYFLYVDHSGSNGVTQTIFVNALQLQANQYLPCTTASFPDPSPGNAKTCFLQNY